MLKGARCIVQHWLRPEEIDNWAMGRALVRFKSRYYFGQAQKKMFAFVMPTWRTLLWQTPFTYWLTSYILLYYSSTSSRMVMKRWHFYSYVSLPWPHSSKKQCLPGDNLISLTFILPSGPKWVGIWLWYLLQDFSDFHTKIITRQFPIE